jgi:hypothetical protein
MCFYLEGRGLPDGPYFKSPGEFPTIDAALAAARDEMSAKNVALWIKDERNSLILSIKEVRERLGETRPAV